MHQLKHQGHAEAPQGHRSAGERGTSKMSCAGPRVRARRRVMLAMAWTADRLSPTLPLKVRSSRSARPLQQKHTGACATAGGGAHRPSTNMHTDLSSLHHVQVSMPPKLAHSRGPEPFSTLRHAPAQLLQRPVPNHAVLQMQPAQADTNEEP